MLLLLLPLLLLVAMPWTATSKVKVDDQLRCCKARQRSLE